MAYDFVLPDLGEGVTEGEITAWLVTVGQTVAEDDPLVEVETDKATAEIPSPVDGVVAVVHAAEGDRVRVGSLLITIDTEDEAETPAASDGAATRHPLVRATPSVRNVANELGVDLATMVGTGPDGAITEHDVRSAHGGATAARGRREPLRGVRRRIAERLTQSHQEVPKVTVVEECDFTELSAKRGELSFVPFVVQAVVSGLKQFPEFNATLSRDEIIYHDRYDIGVAAQGAKGLVVPVLHAADQLTLPELDAAVKRLAEAVRHDTIAPEDLRDSTFTVTLAGKLGGYFATPLVNPGEAAILGVHRIAERAVVREGEIVIRQMGLVSCSFDHRITDGIRATMFILHVIEELQGAAVPG
jgi:pyruvate dehydrogenase E2 component (dihydrolipoamide acetyltransferase)